MEKILSVQDLKKDWYIKQIFNIDTFCKLDRKNLGADEGEIQRKLLLKEFGSGEKLYIIYPGKEARITSKRKSKNEKDFGPLLTLKNSEGIKTTTFGDVWEDIFTLNEKGINMDALATIFIRMAYMFDSKKIKRVVKYEDIQNKSIVKIGELELEYYEYSPSIELFEELGISIYDEIKGSKIIPYLSYIDLISQNEDCKYSLLKGSKWNHSSGRLNTCLTHVTMIAYLEDKIKLSKLFEKLMRGVAPITQNEFDKVTNHRIIKKGSTDYL